MDMYVDDYTYIGISSIYFKYFGIRDCYFCHYPCLLAFMVKLKFAFDNISLT